MAGKLIVAAVLGVSLSVACSSGGSGGGGSGGTQVPATVNYDFTTLAAPLEIEFSGGEIDLLLYLAGIYNIGPGEYTIAPGPLMDLDTGVLYGELAVEVIDTVLAEVDELPTAGSIQIRQVSSGDVITVTVNNAVPGVDLTYDAGGDGIGIIGPVIYTWDDFEDLQDSGVAEEWEEIASFVYSTIEFVYARFFIIVEAFTYGFDNEEDIELGGVGTFWLVRDCDFYASDVQPVGNVFLQWQDVDMDFEITPGDTFLIDVQRCWVDDPASDFDAWFHGAIRVEGLIDVTNPFMAGGTVVFDNFIERETELDGQGGFVQDSEVTLNGESDVLFTE